MPTGAAVDGDILTDGRTGEATGARELAGLAVTVGHALAEVEPAWRSLEARGVLSPGQSFDFVAGWVKARAIPERRQVYVTASLEGAPIALLALELRIRFGLRTLTWFPGAHVGCNAPLLDPDRFATLGIAQRAALWQAMAAAIPNADLLFLPHLPEAAFGRAGLFDQLGQRQFADTLYQAKFSSWEGANTTQRSKSRRKHDRQQGERLEALGAVAFSEIGNGAEAEAALGVMFRQRAERFRQMGVADPFAPADIARFYADSVKADSPIKVRMHLLRLDGEIVAVRYNIALGDTLFCLISSMSDDPAIQGGSPGKQCLLRVMQTVFEAGWRNFDMGAGFTDEKRHWCNTRTGLDHHYVPLTLRGRLAVRAHCAWQDVRTRIKSDPRLLAVAKNLRATLLRVRGGSEPAPETPASD